MQRDSAPIDGRGTATGNNARAIGACRVQRAADRDGSRARAAPSQSVALCRDSRRSESRTVRGDSPVSRLTPMTNTIDRRRQQRHDDCFRIYRCRFHCAPTHARSSSRLSRRPSRLRGRSHNTVIRNRLIPLITSPRGTTRRYRPCVARPWRRRRSAFPCSAWDLALPGCRTQRLCMHPIP